MRATIITTIIAFSRNYSTSMYAAPVILLLLLLLLVRERDDDQNSTTFLRRRNQKREREREREREGVLRTRDRSPKIAIHIRVVLESFLPKIYPVTTAKVRAVKNNPYIIISEHLVCDANVEL